MRANKRANAHNPPNPFCFQERGELAGLCCAEGEREADAGVGAHGRVLGQEVDPVVARHKPLQHPQIRVRTVYRALQWGFSVRPGMIIIRITYN